MNNLTKVQKKNKKTKPTAFWAFACDLKETKLLRIHNENQLREIASPLWKRLSEAEKEKYKELAKSMEPTLNKNRKVFNSIGQDVQEVEAKEKLQAEKKISMVQEIQRLLDNSNDIGELDNLVFYFISVSSFYANDDDIYPAELAMAKFSLKEGIIDDVQIRINPGELPLGSSATVEENAKTLKYDVPPKCQGETDYMNILETMIKFLHPMDKLPIFFTEIQTRDNPFALQETQRIVKKIFFESQEDDMIEELKIYPVENLFHALHKLTTANKNRLNHTKDVGFTSFESASDKFRSFDFHYSSNGCDFHHAFDADPICCLSVARRYGYMIAKWCSDKNRYKLLPKKHVPDGYIL